MTVQTSHAVRPAEEHCGEHAQAQPGAEGHPVFEQGAHQGDSHHVAGGLRMAAAVDVQGYKGQRHTHGGVDGHRARGAEALPLFAAAKQRQRVLQGVGGGEVLHDLSGPGGPGVAVEELVEQAVQQGVDDVGQHVENTVEGGQGQDVAGEHGAEGGEGEEEQAHAALTQQPHQQGGHRRAPVLHGQEGQLHHGRQYGGYQLGQQQEGQPRQVLGGEQGLPPGGQGVEPAGGAAVIQIAEHRHSAENGKEGSQIQAKGGHFRQIHRADQQTLLGIAVHIAAKVGVEHVQRDKKQPNHPVARPQGPEAGQSLAVEGAVKVRCRGPHSSHLPVHR